MVHTFLLSELFLKRENKSFLDMISDGLASISSRMDLLVSLSGALTTSLLGLVVPAGLDLLLSENISAWKKAKNWFLITIGVMGFLVGTTISIKQLIQE